MAASQPFCDVFMNSYHVGRLDLFGSRRSIQCRRATLPYFAKGINFAFGSFRRARRKSPVSKPVRKDFGCLEKQRHARGECLPLDLDIGGRRAGEPQRRSTLGVGTACAGNDDPPFHHGSFPLKSIRVVSIPDCVGLAIDGGSLYWERFCAETPSTVVPNWPSRTYRRLEATVWTVVARFSTLLAHRHMSRPKAWLHPWRSRAVQRLVIAVELALVRSSAFSAPAPLDWRRRGRTDG